MQSQSRPALMIAAALIVAGCDTTLPTALDGAGLGPKLSRSAAAPVHQVTGGGKLDISSFDPELPPETYTFSASVDGNGNVRGQMQIRLSDPLVDLHARVTCLAVNGASAWIGGVITHSSDENIFPLDGEFWFRVQDNGEGSADPRDRMSFVRLGAPAHICDQQRQVGMPFEWLHGNVRVR